MTKRTLGAFIMIACIIGVIIISIFLCTGKTIEKITDCYDRYSNKIIGQQCISTEIEGMSILVPLLLLFMVGTVIGEVIFLNNE